MPSVMSTDVLIVGAGVAGLWLNARLRRQGFSTVLVESATLGGGQSVKSQGSFTAVRNTPCTVRSPAPPKPLPTCRAAGVKRWRVTVSWI